MSNIFNLLKGLVKLAPKKDIRYYLNGIYIERKKQHVNVIETDGHQMVKATIDPDLVKGLEEGESVIFDRASVDIALKAFSKKDVEIAFEKVGDDWQLTNGFIKMPLTTIDGNYPNWHRVWPDKYRFLNPCTDYAISAALVGAVSAALSTIPNTTFAGTYLRIPNDPTSAMKIDLYLGENNEGPIRTVEAIIMPMRLGNAAKKAA